MFHDNYPNCVPQVPHLSASKLSNPPTHPKERTLPFGVGVGWV